MSEQLLTELVSRGVASLEAEDPELSGLLREESLRQSNVLSMVASSSVVDPSVLVSEAMAPVNVTAEGYPAARYHAGCSVIDDIERLAVDRAKRIFNAQYANVQPHSATTANQLAMCALLRPGDVLMGLDLDCGGHLTHGSKPSLSGQYFRAISYATTDEGIIDYQQVEELAAKHQPKLIVCGTTAYPRAIDFVRFRHIADKVGAYLLADITHIAGLVVAGLHPSPIDSAHITTTCTHKQLYGPRGGLILIGRDHDQLVDDRGLTMSGLVQRAVFPFFQGAPNMNSIAAKARAFGRVSQPEFRILGERIVATARVLAEEFLSRGYRVITGGTDNHIVVIDLRSKGVSGLVAERCLEDCGVIVNRNRIPGDKKPARISSGIRIGTNSLAARGLADSEMRQCAALIDRVLSETRSTGDSTYELETDVRTSVRESVSELCRRRPMPGYPRLQASVS